MSREVLKIDYVAKASKDVKEVQKSERPQDEEGFIEANTERITKIEVEDQNDNNSRLD